MPKIDEAVERFVSGSVEAALELLTLTETSCILVAASEVGREWERNLKVVSQTVRAKLSQTDEQSRRFHDACGSLGLWPGFPPSRYSDIGLVERLEEISRRLLAAALSLERDDACDLRAMARAKERRPPSRTRGEICDATIIEEYLELSRRLRDHGHRLEPLFCTTNTSDFCRHKSYLHASLAEEFTATRLGFAVGLPWASARSRSALIAGTRPGMTSAGRPPMKRIRRRQGSPIRIDRSASAPFHPCAGTSRTSSHRIGRQYPSSRLRISLCGSSLGGETLRQEA